jgi:hypothetical protein
MRKVLLALTVVVALMSSAASTATTQGQQGQAFRGDLVRFLTQMKPVAAKLDRNGLAGAGISQRAALANAIASVKTATPAQLSVLQRALSAYPAWRTLPQKLSKLVARMPNDRKHSRRPARSSKTTITPDDCATARAAGYTQTDVEIAADVALVADAVLEAIPQDSVDEVVRAIAVGVWAIPQGVLRGFEHLYNIASACDDADHQALVTNNLDVKVSSRATQGGLDSLTLIVQNATTSISNSLASLQTATAALKTDVDNSFSAVTTQITNVQTGVDTANANIQALAANVGANNDLNIRLHIEEDLANPGNHPVALFELPAVQGGYLELSRSIVADIIQQTTASGQSVGNAQAFLTSGDDARAAGRFKEAYAAYGKAYQAAAK